jgi:hypothetical protein
MGIQEMRSSINAENIKKNGPELPPSAPDWVVRGIFERRNNLPLTPLPAEVRSKVSTLVAAVRTDANKAQRDALRRKLIAALLT